MNKTSVYHNIEVGFLKFIFIDPTISHTMISSSDSIRTLFIV